ncbi:MAG: ABC transporter ATP-binding protein [Actinobacteria bacterium]|nr:ABC transporter ATP-binding protein [Actinomycetota bacterium]
MIELRELCRTFVVQRGREEIVTRALGPITLSIADLQFVGILGRSGSGKTTLLRLIAGLVQPTAGDVLVDGQRVRGPGPDRAVVFQQSALYPWRTVEANVRLGLELSRLAKKGTADEIVHRLLDLVGLGDFGGYYPNQLSGGMQQRVGLARALAVSPRHLLMDEPFGSVDAILRRELGAELLRIWELDRRTVVFITHSVEEALTLSDRVIVLKDGLVADDVTINLPRPRDPEAISDDPAFLQLRRSLLTTL